ncbi:hypothetical protein SLH46_09385 [Draconibacterium sp. IB214405]|uniref:hypothetical protein n=1 Tax=Draconibacterium sp. IB214405 TaxID=3097352 RepID=UPI002A0E9698|nr:hypothetical protein [Draconibacterium sp. IB214405]MDX8339393.1 hypothetical protein [Draconibacterium sp. IB214405]
MKQVKVKSRVFHFPIHGMEGVLKFLTEILEICELRNYQDRNTQILEMIIWHNYDGLISEISETSGIHYTQAREVVLRLILIFEICLIAATETMQERSDLIDGLIDQLSVLVRTDKQRISLDDLNGYLHAEGIDLFIAKKSVPGGGSDAQTTLVLQKRKFSKLTFEGEIVFPVCGICKN